MRSASPQRSATALRVVGLRKAFGTVTVLDSVDLEVPRGSVTAVLGPSGGGKTTLLRIIAGFERPDAGTVEIDGRLAVAPGVDVPAERRRVGIVPQEGALFPHLDVVGNVGFGLHRGAARSERISEVLRLVGLEGFERRRPHELSGGQQHRVALARALAPHPSLVMLDEPFSSLDTGLRAQVRDEVLGAIQAADITAVLVTHDQVEALSIADQVAVLLDGRVAQSAEPATLYDAPTTLGVASFVGDAVVLPGVRDGNSVTCDLGSLSIRPTTSTASEPSSSTSEQVWVVIRPEQVVLGDASSGGVEGTVLSTSFYGHDAVVSVELIGGTVISARLSTTHLPRRADVVTVRVLTPVSVFSLS